MDTAARRKMILTLLQQADEPISATTIAKQFSVSRQIVVGDIALLRAEGENISATPQGYLIPKEQSGIVRIVACVHDAEKMKREMEIIVACNCQILDVIVEHPVYGQIVAQLQVSTQEGVNSFIRSVGENNAKPLADLTHGIHLHTLRCPDEEAYKKVIAALGDENFLLGLHLL